MRFVGIPSFAPASLILYQALTGLVGAHAANVDAAAVNVVLDTNHLDQSGQRRSFAAPILYARAIPTPAALRLCGE